MLHPHRTQVLIWLLVCVSLVFGMVILGGSVRLTGSGLSMVDWKPILGIIPPLSQDGWLAAFDQYKQYPEYQLVNKGMTLAGFKFIFMMEYLHRVLGRLIGIVFFLPFCYFLLRGGMPSTLKSRLWFLLFLGACQGLMGWYMVQSGLISEPHVSQYRLTAHLMLAVVIYSLMLRLVFDLLYRNERGAISADKSSDRSISVAGGVVVLLVLLMITTGGLMAGTRAGHIYNTWPMMGHTWLPDMLFAMQPWWKNLFENTITIQFIHRWMAILVAAGVVWFCFQVLRSSTSRLARTMALVGSVLVFVQIILGILTLIHGVPMALGVAHQGCALLVLAAVIGAWVSELPTVSHSR